MTTIYENLNNLDVLELRAGSDKVLTVTCYQEDGVNLLNITGGTFVWKLCPYGQFDMNVLTIAGVIVVPEELSKFTVTISKADTLSLSGKYTQQIEVTDNSGQTFTVGQGDVIIFPRITD